MLVVVEEEEELVKMFELGCTDAPLPVNKGDARARKSCLVLVASSWGLGRG